MSHITRSRKNSEDYQTYLDYLDDQYCKDNFPFGTNKPISLDDKDIKMLGGKRKKIQKRKRKRKMKK